MQLLKTITALGLATAVSAQVQGFNYGATNEDGSCRSYDDFVRLFNRAKNLAGTKGFTSARLYTSIQCGTPAEPISAFRAAIDTDTSLLVGLWASAGRGVYENELNALLAAARNLGRPFTDRIVGISVGSEDLYRSSPQGVANNAGVGATGAEIEGYIGWMRDWIRGTALESKPIGHVDTWTAWILPENQGVARSVNFLGHNSFPYFETTKPNSIDRAADNFWSAVAETERIAAGKPVFITETGWPHSRFPAPSPSRPPPRPLSENRTDIAFSSPEGPNQRDAVANVANAQRYWKTVGCPTFGKRNMWWYTLVDANTAQTDISFGVTPLNNAKPVFDLRC
ncbi:hypothetical protein DL769_004157 [Monosporascus sp. CRB-8-3]|nr:hypothetical protein DL769_004157 [Monosporascus sp. CRB-8-3]